jgi:hypothetical protein
MMTCFVGIIVSVYVLARPSKPLEKVSSPRSVTYSELAELEFVAVKLRCSPIFLKEIGICTDEDHKTLEARLEKAGVKVPSPDTQSCPQLLLTISIEGNATREILLSQDRRTIKGDAILYLLYHSEESVLQGWTTRCDFVCVPTTLQPTVQDAVDRLVGAFIDELEKGQRDITDSWRHEPVSAILSGMPCTTRAIEAGLVYHVLNRGNVRLRLFRKDEDFEAYERALAEWLQRHPVDSGFYTE